MSRKIEKKRSFCSGVPVARTGGPPRPGPGKLSMIEASAQASSSAPIAAVRLVCTGLVGSRLALVPSWKSSIGFVSPLSAWLIP
jgi:hypothetical protein